MPQRALDFRDSLLKAAAVGLLVFAAGAPGLARAVDFVESPDAGQTPPLAQSTYGVASPGAALTSISGSLFSEIDADLFTIDIVDPLAFSANTVNGFTDDFLDTQLFLFSPAGAPIYSNDDAPSGTSLQSTLPAGDALRPSTAGRYLLGISLSGYDPVNAANQLLFMPLGSFTLSTDVRGPNTGLQPALLTGFAFNGLAGSGSYRIQLTGAVTAATPVPEPSTWILFAVGLAGVPFLSRRRRSLRTQSLAA